VNIAPVLEDFLVMIRVKVKGFSNSHQICAWQMAKNAYNMLLQLKLTIHFYMILGIPKRMRTRCSNESRKGGISSNDSEMLTLVLCQVKEPEVLTGDRQLY
jgi:hypothetical protein